MSYEDLAGFVDYLRRIQVQDDNDIFIGITGRKGCGKSSLSLQIARQYVKKYFNEPTIKLDKYMAYNNNDVIEKIHTLPKYSPLIGDEAVRFAWSRDWNKSENKELARLSAQIRTKKLIFFMNIPKLAWIDSVYREGMLDIWIWVHATFSEVGKQSHALIFEPDDNQGEGDSWHMDILRKYSKSKKHRIGRFTDINRVYKMVNKHPCFVDAIKFPKLPQELYDRYLAVRNERAFEKEGMFVSQKDTSKIAVWNLKKRWNKLVEAVKQGRYPEPSFDMMSQILFEDPRTKEIIAKKSTVTKWYNEMRESIPLEVQKPLENETDKIEPDSSDESNMDNI